VARGTLPEGAYYFEVLDVGELRQSKSGINFYIIDVKIPHTDLITQWTAPRRDLASLGLDPNQLNGRQFLFVVRHVEYNRQTRLMLGQPLAEVIT
jgi:hypothetical protein